MDTRRILAEDPPTSRCTPDARYKDVLAEGHVSVIRGGGLRCYTPTSRTQGGTGIIESVVLPVAKCVLGGVGQEGVRYLTGELKKGMKR